MPGRWGSGSASASMVTCRCWTCGRSKRQRLADPSAAKRPKTGRGNMPKTRGLAIGDTLKSRETALIDAAYSEGRGRRTRAQFLTTMTGGRRLAGTGLVQPSVLHRQGIQPAPRRNELMRSHTVCHSRWSRRSRQSASVDGDAIRALAARSMIASGIGHNAAEDISAITRKLRQSGVRQDGQQTDLVWDKVTVRGKERTIVSTDKH